MERALGPRQPQGLVDILDKILDKGLVVAGDIKVNLANVELLTIQLRLVVCSIDKAEEIGLGWWKNDRFYSGKEIKQVDHQELHELRDRVNQLERQLSAGGQKPKGGSQKKPADSKKKKEK